MSIVSSVDYAKDGRTIDSWHIEKITLRPIVPDSMGESLYKAVCQNKKKGKE
jgi:hypothetical protein